MYIRLIFYPYNGTLTVLLPVFDTGEAERGNPRRDPVDHNESEGRGVYAKSVRGHGG
ncbi:hypothetical protein Holit_02285 [Hollandina sp. SP2]